MCTDSNYATVRLRRGVRHLASKSECCRILPVERTYRLDSRCACIAHISQLQRLKPQNSTLRSDCTGESWIAGTNLHTRRSVGFATHSRSLLETGGRRYVTVMDELFVRVSWSAHGGWRTRRQTGRVHTTHPPILADDGRSVRPDRDRRVDRGPLAVADGTDQWREKRVAFVEEALYQRGVDRLGVHPEFRLGAARTHEEPRPVL